MFLKKIGACPRVWICGMQGYAGHTRLARIGRKHASAGSLFRYVYDPPRPCTCSMQLAKGGLLRIVKREFMLVEANHLPALHLIFALHLPFYHIVTHAEAGRDCPSAWPAPSLSGKFSCTPNGATVYMTGLRKENEKNLDSQQMHTVYDIHRSEK
jgi:hypothetical protein